MVNCQFVKVRDTNLFFFKKSQEFSGSRNERRIDHINEARRSSEFSGSNFWDQRDIYVKMAKNLPKTF